MKRINEIFYSIQGEGFFTGTPVIFIRFSGCNLSCAFCDTEFAHFKKMKNEEIIAEVEKYPSKHIVLTGGEPTLQLGEGDKLLVTLKEKGYFLQMETNGTGKIHRLVDWATCSPKLPNYNGDCDELKVVYTGQDLSQYQNVKTKHRYLQPCSGKNTKEVIEIIKQDPQWKLSIQTHKLLKIQ